MKIHVLSGAKKKRFLLGFDTERLIIGNSLIKLYRSPSVVSAILGTFFL